MIDLSQYQNTQTIIHIDNPKHWEMLEPLIWKSFNITNHNDGTLCIWLNHNQQIYNTYGNLNYALKTDYKNFNIIKSSKILNKNKIYELW